MIAIKNNVFKNAIACVAFMTIIESDDKNYFVPKGTSLLLFSYLPTLGPYGTYDHGMDCINIGSYCS